MQTTTPTTPTSSSVPRVRCACAGCEDREPRPFSEMQLIRVVPLERRASVYAAIGAESIDGVPSRLPGYSQLLWAHPVCASDEYLDPDWWQGIEADEADAEDSRIAGTLPVFAVVTRDSSVPGYLAVVSVHADLRSACAECGGEDSGIGIVQGPAGTLAGGLLRSEDVEAIDPDDLSSAYCELENTE